MAGNIFSLDSFDVSAQPLGAKPAPKVDPKAAIDGIATKYKVPANVLIAVAEAAGLASIEQIEADALRISEGVKGGKDIDTLVTERFGGADQGKVVINRAFDIADAMYPAPAAAPVEQEKPGALATSARFAGEAASKGLGMAVDYAGNAVDRAAEYVVGDAYRTVTGGDGKIAPVQPVAEQITRGWDRAGDFIGSGISDESRQLAHGALPTGNIADPSTWKGPEDFSLEGLSYVAAQGIGSLGPVVLSAIVSKNPATVGAVVGGAMAGGDGRQTAATEIDRLWNEKAEDGSSRLAAESDVFRDLIAKGAAPDAAYQQVRTQAMNVAGDLQAIIGGAGGAVTGGIVTKGLPEAIAGKTLAGSMARGVAVSAAEEGIQEATETAAARTGINIGAGTSLDVGEGTVEAGLAGAIAGGPFGALGAKRPTQQPQPETLALPAPPLGLPAPDGASQVQPTPSGDGSAGGQAVAPLSNNGGIPPIGGATADQAAPKGPIESIAAMAPDMTPQAPAPAPNMLFPEFKSGSAVQLVDPDTGEFLDATFLREETDGVVVRIGGGEVKIDPQTFDAAKKEADAVNAAAKQTPKPAPAAAPVPKPAAPLAAKPEIDPFDAAMDAPPDAPIDFPQTSPALRKPTPPLKATSPQVSDNLPQVSTEPTPPLQATTPKAESTNQADPLRTEITKAMSQPMATHTTAKGKVLTGVIVPASQFKKADADKADPYSFRKPMPDGSPGWFIKAGPAQNYVGGTAEVLPAASSPEKPEKAVASAIEAAAAATNPEPTPAQAEAENYKTGKAPWQGQTLSIENAKGSMRRKITPDGKTEWEVKMPAHYGRILGTVGADGDHMDFYMGPNPDAPFVWVIDQKHAETGKFDEHKMMIGFDTLDQATAAYVAGFSDGKGTQRLGGIKKMNAEGAAVWAKEGNTKSPVSPKMRKTWSDEDLSKAEITDEERQKRRDQTAPFEIAATATKQTITEDEAREYGIKAFNDGYQRLVPPKLRERGEVFAQAWYQGWDKANIAAPVVMDEVKNESPPKTPPSVSNVTRADQFRRRFANGGMDDLMGNPELADVVEYGNWLGSLTDGQWKLIEGVFKSGHNPFVSAGSMNIPLRRGELEAALGQSPSKQSNDAPAADSKPAKPTPTGIKGLSEAENARMAELQAKFKAKITSQINSGLDPELITMAVEMGGLYIKAGARRFRALIDSMMNDMGLTLEQAQPYARNAYNQIRGNMDLDGESIVDMDSDADVIAEVRKMRADATKKPDETVKSAPQPEALPPVATKKPTKPAKEVVSINGGVDRAIDISALQSVDFDAWDDQTREDGQMSPAKRKGRDETGRWAKSLVKTLKDMGFEPTLVPKGKPKKEVSFGYAMASEFDETMVYLTAPNGLDLYVKVGNGWTTKATLNILVQLRGKNAHGGNEYLAQDITPRDAAAQIAKWAERRGDAAPAVPTAEDINSKIKEVIAIDDAISTQGGKDGMMGNNPSNEGGDVTRNTIRSSSSGELEASPQEPLQDLQVGGPIGPRGADGEQGSGTTGSEPDGARPDQTRGGGDGAAGDGKPAARPAVTRKPRPKKTKEAPMPEEIGGLFSANSAVVAAAKVNIPAVNFTITESLRLGQGGQAEKYADNIAAIRTLKKIEGENRRATPDEQAILARYVGWGGLKNAFRVAGSTGDEGISKGWEKRVREVEELLEPAELAVARNSTKAAHYTSETVVQAIWEGARRLGFRGGAVLEPSVGSGNFLGLMPQDLRGTSKITGVEYDAITAGIAKMLYPASNILHSGFEKLPIPSGSHSLAIGNPPFGRDQLYFRHNPDVNRKSIHNQFFLASMDALAPDGILAMVVSHYLMDSLDNSNRIEMAGRASLVHAIRLPSNAFEENARTEVVTDILFFKKHSAEDAQLAKFVARLHGQEDAAIRSQMSKEVDKKPLFSGSEITRALEISKESAKWIAAEKINDPAGSGETINVNSYFLRNSGRMIGKLDASGTMNGRAGLNVTMEDPSAFRAQLNEAIEAMPSIEPNDTIAAQTLAGYASMSESLDLSARNAEPGGVRIAEGDALKMVIDVDAGADAKTMLLEIDLDESTPFNSEYSMTKDRKWQITEDVIGENGKPVKVLKADGTPSTRNVKTVKVFDGLSGINTKHLWGKDRIQILRDMLPIRDLFKRQLVLETQEGTEAQIETNRDELNKAYDAFVKKHGKMNSAKVSKIAMLMPDGPLALGVEAKNEDGSLAKSAIMSVRTTFPPKIAESADTASDAVVISLSERGVIDINRIADLLDVDVDEAAKMLGEGAEPRAFFDPETNRWEDRDLYLSGMVRKKLYAAQQAGLQKNVDALEAVMPEKWDSTKVTPSIGSTWIPTDIYQDFLKHLGYSRSIVGFQEATNLFSGDVDGEAKPVWKTTGRAFSAGSIVFRMLNSQPMKVTYTDSEKKTHVDEQASVESQQKATEIASEFLDWAFNDDARRTRLVDIFNEKFNTRLIRQRDGSHLTLPGVNPAIKLRRHQLNAIWRGITDKAILMDHAVGAGKTFTAIARVMERRRMGLSRKPLIVVPNHIVGQWRKDFLTLYPGANILAASEADFQVGNRRRLFARIAAGNYDAVIIGHSSFGFIDIDPSTEIRFLEDELRVALAAVGEAEEAAMEAGFSGWGKPMGVSEAERLVTKIQTRLDKIRDGKRDRLLTFEEMGIDDVTIDESHEFKNLAYSSRLQNVSGMGNKNGSAKATDLHLKLRSLHERPNTSIAFLSGTPISNSVSEMYLILRNLVPNELREMGLENFDAWRSMFVSTATQWEPTESGGLKEVNRLGREWTNMRTLMDLYYTVADAVPIEDVAKNHAIDNNGERFPLPPVKSRVDGGSDREMISVKPDDAQRRLLRDIVSGFEGLPGISNPKQRNGERLRLMDKARKVSLDARAVDPTLSVKIGTGKIGAVVDNAVRLYQKWADHTGTQIIFLDRSVPKAKGDDAFIAEYDALRAKQESAELAGNDAEVAKLTEKLDTYDMGDVAARRSALEGGWNAYDEIKRQLVGKGIPADQIEFVQSAGTPAEKAEMFARVNSGQTRIILGSTPRMGAGTNIQKRLVGLHHVDVTWKPSDIEQREGRIIRQGNDILGLLGADMFAAEVIAYATEMTVDAKMWSLNSTKLKAINGIRKYDGSFAMEFEDEDAASMAEMAALATGNPLMVERTVLDGDLNKLDMSRRSFNSRMNGMRGELADANRTIETADDIAAVDDAFAVSQERARDAIAKRSKSRMVDINGKTYTSESEARLAINTAIAEQKAGDENARWKITMGGNPVTNADTANGEMNRIFGVEGFEASVDGITHVSMSRASAAISNKITKAIMEQRDTDTISIDGISIMGLPVEVDVFPKPYTRNPEDKRVSFNFMEGRKVAWTTEADADGKSISQQAARAVLDRLHSRMTPDASRASAKWQRDKKKAAIAKKPELETELKKPWPKSDEYEKKRDRLNEVVIELAKASDSSRLGEDDAGDGETTMEMRSSLMDAASIQPVPVSSMRSIAATVAQEVANAGLTGKVSPRVVRGLLGAAGVPIQGRQSGATIDVNPDSPDVVGVMRHEIVHALRDEGLWGRPYGLFTAPEWRALVKAARADKAIMARVEAAYSDLGTSAKTEEAVAELYREWASSRDNASKMGRIFAKVQSLFRAMASALRGEGFTDADMVMERIASGEVGGRGPDGSGGMDAPQRTQDREMRDALMQTAAKAKGMIGREHWRSPSEWLTDAMSGKNGYGLLALVPGRGLFSELGKTLISAKSYLRTKEEMDSLRNDWHSLADKTAQKWLSLRRKMPRENDALMDLMHRSTQTGIDPSKRDTWRHAFEAPARREVSKHGDAASNWAKQVIADIDAHTKAYSTLKGLYDALPKEFQEVYGEVKSNYDKLGDDFEDAVLGNIENAQRIGLKRAERAHRKEMLRIKDEGLEGAERDEAIEKADGILDAIKKRGGWTGKARISALRKQFESNRLKGPYFPLARFGEYFATVRDEKGAVISFSRFESVKKQAVFVKEQQALHPDRVSFGVMGDKDALKDQVNPAFVAEVESILAAATASNELMDAVWQKYLETLPDASIRTSKIHRKNRAGFSEDAFRAFGKHMFHGAHQLARLKYGIILEEHMETAEEEARRAEDPNRAGMIVNEMRKRHAFTMNPQGNAAIAQVSGLAFIWYLGATPAAALANLSQTTVVGPGLMAARFKTAGVKGSLSALSTALADFARGKGSIEKSPTLASDEVAAVAEAVRRGTIDKTQAHDLASVAESGIEYSAKREQVMRIISAFFHHAERLNREVTFLANYRLAKAEGMDQSEAIDAAADMTWKIHFDYQNTSRPRFMQNDIGKVLTVFRNFTINMLWRLFRDSHQALRGKSKEERAEARTQLIGVTLSMMAHAGIKGTWGYGILMLLLGMFFPGGGDDAEKWLQDALLVEGDSLGTASWNFAMGAALEGVPGRVLGLDLTERIGMPNLWFRGAGRDLEGEDLYASYVGEILGPVFGIGQGMFRGAGLALDGDVYRGTETAVPKVVRDLMKAGRYAYEGVETKNGDTILESVNPYQLIVQASGFTPAEIAERYEINSRLKNEEKRVMDERSDIHRAAGTGIRAGKGVDPSVIAKIHDFNRRYPEYPITSDTIRQSVRSRMRASERNEFGIQLNPKLNDRLRTEQPPSIYN